MQLPDFRNSVAASAPAAQNRTAKSPRPQNSLVDADAATAPGKSGVRLSPRAAAVAAASAEASSRRPGRPSPVPATTTTTRQQQQLANHPVVDVPPMDDADEDVGEEGGGTAAAAGSDTSTTRPVAWQCGACSYCILAMDQHGTPLPITNDAWGKPLPLQCPRCLQVHDAWSLQTPFDEYGEHVNVKGSFSNSVHTRQQQSQPPPPSSIVRGEVHQQQRETATIAKRTSDTHILENLPPVLASIGLVTYRDGVAVSTVRPPSPKRIVRQAYYCALCNRKLLRIDQYGAMVPLDVDGDGRPLPLMCPGCKNTHSDWPIRTF